MDVEEISDAHNDIQSTPAKCWATEAGVMKHQDIITMLKKVGDTIINRKHRATCHCGSVELEVDLPHGIVDPQRCDCSICRRKGAVVASVPLSGVKIVKGEDELSLYQFDTKEAKHYFCSICGIYTHHKRRSNPDQYGINIGCLEDVNPYLIENVPTGDGINHPSDRIN